MDGQKDHNQGDENLRAEELIHWQDGERDHDAADPRHGHPTTESGQEKARVHRQVVPVAAALLGKLLARPKTSERARRGDEGG